MGKKHMKIKIVVAILTLVILSGMIFFYQKLNSKQDAKINNQIYFLGKKEGKRRDVAVLIHGNMHNLGPSLYGFVNYIPIDKKYLIQKPIGDNYELEAINLNGNIKKLGQFNDSQNDMSNYNGYEAIDINGEFLIINIKTQKKYNFNYNNEKNFILTISDGEIFYLNSKNELCRYNLKTEKNNVLLKGENNFFIQMATNKDGIYFISNNGEIGFFDKKTQKFSILKQNGIPKEIRNENSQNTYGISKAKVNDEGDLSYFYNYGNDQNALIYKGANLSAKIIDSNLLDSNKVGEDYFYSTKNNRGKIIDKVYCFNKENKLSELPVQGLKLNTIKSASKGEFYGVTMNNNDLYKFNLRTNTKSLIATNIKSFVIEDGSLIYDKLILSSKDANISRLSLYNIYENGRLIVKNAINASLSGNRVFYINDEGKFFMAENNKIKEIDTSKYQEVQQINNETGGLLVNYNLNLSLNEISGYWKVIRDNKVSYYRITSNGFKEVSSDNINYDGIQIINSTVNSANIALPNTDIQNLKVSLVNQQELKDSLGGTWTRIPKSIFENAEKKYIKKYGYSEMIKRFLAISDIKNSTISNFMINGQKYYLVSRKDNSTIAIMSSLGNFYNYCDYETKKTLVLSTGWLYTGVKKLP